MTRTSMVFFRHAPVVDNTIDDSVRYNGKTDQLRTRKLLPSSKATSINFCTLTGLFLQGLHSFALPQETHSLKFDQTEEYGNNITARITTLKPLLFFAKEFVQS